MIPGHNGPYFNHANFAFQRQEGMDVRGDDGVTGKRKHPFEFHNIKHMDQEVNNFPPLYRYQTVLKGLLDSCNHNNQHEVASSIVEVIRCLVSKNLDETLAIRDLQEIQDFASRNSMMNVTEAIKAAWILLGCRDDKRFYAEHAVLQDWADPTVLNMHDESGRTIFDYAEQNRNLTSIAQQIYDKIAIHNGIGRQNAEARHHNDGGHCDEKEGEFDKHVAYGSMVDDGHLD